MDAIFVPAPPGTYLLQVYRTADDPRGWSCQKDVVVGFAVRPEATELAPFALIPIREDCVYIGCQHPTGEVSVARDRFTYANATMFARAAEAMLKTTWKEGDPPMNTESEEIEQRVTKTGSNPQQLPKPNSTRSVHRRLDRPKGDFI